MASIVRPAQVPRFITLLVGLAAILAIMTNLEYRLEINPFYDWTSTFLGPLVLVPPDLHTIDYSGRTTVYASMSIRSSSRSCSTSRCRSRSCPCSRPPSAASG